MTYQLLLAESSQTICKAIEITLASEDFAITTVNNGKTALQKAADHNFDIALIAMHLKELDGLTLSQKLKQQSKTKNLPILFLGNDAASEHVTSSIKKPFETEQLLATIQTLIREKPAQSEDNFDIDIETPEETSFEQNIRQLVEQIAWEIVPKLVENVLEEQLNQIKASLVQESLEKTEM